MSRVTASKRKVQRDLDEQTEACETAQREVEQLRGKLRSGGATRLIGYDISLLLDVLLYVVLDKASHTLSHTYTARPTYD